MSKKIRATYKNQQTFQYLLRNCWLTDIWIVIYRNIYIYIFDAHIFKNNIYCIIYSCIANFWAFNFVWEVKWICQYFVKYIFLGINLFMILFSCFEILQVTVPTCDIIGLYGAFLCEIFDAHNYITWVRVFLAWRVWARHEQG